MSRTTATAGGTGLAALLWLGILAAPVAWALQLLSGWAMEEFSCASGTAGQGVFGLDTTDVVLGISIGAAAVAALGLAAAGWGCRAVHERGGDPRGRRRFMAHAGVLTSGLFLLLIVLALVQFPSLDACTAS